MWGRNGRRIVKIPLCEMRLPAGSFVRTAQGFRLYLSGPNREHYAEDYVVRFLCTGS